jgi:hypothetical protein
MKIDKVIFTSSVEYSDFWEINSRVFKQYLNIEPLLLIFGSKQGLTEEFGQVIEMEFLPGLPKMVQIALWKFYFTKYEPDTTWLIGDIDQIPLQRYHFKGLIQDLPDDSYVHLAQDSCSRRVSSNEEYWRTGESADGSTNLTAHYHVAKGWLFEKFLNLEVPFETHVRNLVSQRLQIMGVSDYDVNDFESRNHFWAFEETYTTNMLRWQNVIGFSKKNGLCRSNLSYDDNLLRSNYYPDIHCPRPFSAHKELIESIVRKAWDEDPD